MTDRTFISLSCSEQNGEAFLKFITTLRDRLKELDFQQIEEPVDLY